MMKLFFALSLGLFTLMISLPGVNAQTTPVSPNLKPVNDPWKPAELLGPAKLAGFIKAGTAPLICNIGSAEDIVDAKHIGPVSEPKFHNKFKIMIAGLAKDKPIVIYCGCCALAKCPNVRPAYLELKAAGFTNIIVLNLAVNLKTNWIDMGFPIGGK